MSAHNKPAAMHQAVGWLVPEAKSKPHSDLIELTRNISRGAELCLQVVVMDHVDRETGQPTLFRPADLEHLMLMTGAALLLLGDRANEAIDAMNKTAKGGAA